MVPPPEPMLEVVGFDHLARLELFQALVARQHRLFLRRPHIGEDQSVELLHGVPGLAHAIALEAAFGLARLLEAMALGIEQPAVVAAANAAVLDAAVIERRAAVAAVRLHQPRPPAPVTEQDEVLAQHADGFRRRAGIGDEADRVPITPQQFAHRLAASDLGQGDVVARKLARIAGAGVDCLAHLRLPARRSRDGFLAKPPEPEVAHIVQQTEPKFEQKGHSNLRAASGPIPKFARNCDMMRIDH